MVRIKKTFVIHQMKDADHRALKLAAKANKVKMEDMAKTIMHEWLEQRGFLQNPFSAIQRMLDEEYQENKM